MIGLKKRRARSSMGELNTYPCPKCGKWHIGRKNKKGISEDTWEKIKEDLT